MGSSTKVDTFDNLPRERLKPLQNVFAMNSVHKSTPGSDLQIELIAPSISDQSGDKIDRLKLANNEPPHQPTSATNSLSINS